MASNNVKLSTYLANEIGWGRITGKPSYYDAKAIKSITRSGTTFTYTCMDGTTGTFTQQDNDHYAWSDITNKPATATRWPSWSEVTDKPTTFTPASHTHSYMPLTGWEKIIFGNKNASLSTLTVAASAWAIVPSGSTDVFGFSFKDTALTTDTGDWRAWLTKASDSATTLNMRIDGTWQATTFIGALQGNVTGNCSGTAGVATKVTVTETGHPSSGSASYYIHTSTGLSGSQDTRGMDDFFLWKSTTSQYLNLSKSGITGGITFHTAGETSGAYGDLRAKACTAYRCWELPDAGGTICLTGHTHAWGDITGKPSTFTPASHTHDISQVTWAAGSNLVCNGANSEWSVDMASSATGSYWHVWSGIKSASCIRCYNADGHVEIPTNYLRLSSTLHIHPPTGAWVEGIRIHPSSAGWSTIILCGTDNTGDTGTSANSYSMHAYQGNFYLARNGSSTGASVFSCLTDNFWRVSTRLYGAVWNDYAEYRQGETTEGGRAVYDDGSGIMKITTERLQAAARLVSDTYGFAVGESDTAHTPIGVGGRVLAYPYRDRNEYKVGDVVCAAPNGTVDIMTRKEIREYPDRMVGIVSEIPNYETWENNLGNGDRGKAIIPVDGRIWVYVR